MDKVKLDMGRFGEQVSQLRKGVDKDVRYKMRDVGIVSRRLGVFSRNFGWMNRSLDSILLWG